MLHPVEIKLNVDAARVDVVGALGQQPQAGTTRQIWFAEERAGVDRGVLTLFTNHVVIRLRSGSGSDDLTVKLRPCTPEQLIGRWTDDFDTKVLNYRVEGDWSRARRVLAASAVSQRTSGSLLETVGPFADPGEAISIKQRQFLKLCGPSDLHVGHLVALGPIVSTKWTDIDIGEGTVNVERWITADLDIVELSTRVSPREHESDAEFEARAVRRQRRLEQAAGDLGLPVDAHRETKTQRVLAALARIAVAR
ncbi:hypothetical protein [Mycolicibacterium cosmeticum]|uniref:hypothetical protein n=1 Tax=Mycolicibacterium cosmeticum TaxID=258533 RepID=UPI0032048F39